MLIGYSIWLVRCDYIMICSVCVSLFLVLMLVMVVVVLLRFRVDSLLVSRYFRFLV